MDQGIRSERTCERRVRFVRLPRLSVPIIILGLGVLPLTLPSSAQNVGFKGGMNRSQFYGAEIGDSENLRALVFGVFAEFNLGGTFSLQPEINYSKRGAREETLLEVARDGVWRYNYFDIVSLLKLRLNSERSSPSFSLFTCPVLSILANSKATGWKPEELHAECAGCAREPISFRYVRLLQHNTKGKDVGGTVGMAVDFGSGPAKVVLDMRYTKMMSEFDKAPYDALYSRKHSALSFQAGVVLTPRAFGGGYRSSLPEDDPERHSIVTLEVIAREDIAGHGETLPVFDVIRLERPEWMDGGQIRATLFVDGVPWDGSGEDPLEWSASEVEEILRMEGAPGAYQGHGVVIEVITRARR